MAFTPLRNIVVQQGDTFSEVLVVKDRLLVLGDYLPSQGSIEIDLRNDLLTDYPTQTELTLFAWCKPDTYPFVDGTQKSWTIKTAEAAVAGSRSLVVDSLPVELIDGEAIAGMAIDLTGWSHRGQIRRQGDNALLPLPDPLATFAFSVNATKGAVEYSLSSAATASIPANCTPFDLSYFAGDPRLAPTISKTDKSKLWKKLAKAAYVFDVESFDDSTVIRQIQGYCFVPGEVTV